MLEEILVLEKILLYFFAKNASLKVIHYSRTEEQWIDILDNPNLG